MSLDPGEMTVNWVDRIDGVGMEVVKYALVPVICAGIWTVGLGVLRVLGRA